MAFAILSPPTPSAAPMGIPKGTNRTNSMARVYLRVSTGGQDLTRQEAIVAGARVSGY